MYINRREPIYFAITHFPEFFVYPIAPFHYDFCEDYKEMMNGALDIAAWIAFRESAKTSWLKILITHAICHNLKRFINYDSYDSDNSEAALFDVANWLQTKQSLILDYGQLFSKKSRDSDEGGSKIRRISKFITANDIMVQAFSTQESARGRVFNEQRPDWWIFDDIETAKTKDSRPVQKKIIDHFNEARTALSSNGTISVLGNYILDDGVIGYIMEAMKDNPRARLRNIPVIIKGKASWPGKYRITNKEAIVANQTIENPLKQKISLQQKRVDLKDAVFEPEMMNNPSKSGDLFFERRLVDAAIERATDPESVNGDLKIWAKFNPKHRYGGGADTAEGIGSDSNASAWIDFSTTPNRLVASFEDNMITPNIFGVELNRQGGLYGYPYLVPEINNTGYATVSELVNEEYPALHMREVKNKVTQIVQKEYGWKATLGTKWQVMGEFKTAFEDGELEILDLGLLQEMRLFRKADARLPGRDKGATKHFDKLRAAALAWHAKEFAPVASEEKKKKFFAKIPGQDGPYRP